MKEIIIATNNKSKLKEFNEILNKFNIKCLGLDDINYNFDIIEDGNTFKENALIKAKTVFEFCSKPVLADDSGLCIDSLNNEPGIYSARYKNLNSFEEKMNYILNTISTNRKAFFNCTLCLYTNDNIYYFEGILNGNISYSITGDNGFGYDPIFIAEGYNETLAQLSYDEKNIISHRSKAVRKFVGFINENNIF